ncbi:death domain-associated protein 6 isoform X2 [Scyliorhinus canicula]|uniref:death domain-associated protein 6 isoform X2 n=1 Tax=Scyliorhinus canicula TaxID=7830 RepID=UPI0018F4EC55|nr:death domain-associated protein 6 isoform X2 [Scyliorhinus canicula]
MNFLQLKYTKAFPDYLSSTEFRNVLGRCLTRVQGKKSKVFVYINELCTALKANSQKTKLALASKENSKLPVPAEGPEGPGAQEQSGCPERTATQSGDAAAASTSVESGPAAAKKKHAGSGSRRQIRYLENLLKVYADEIQRLQEKELDLNELEDEDSSYIQEHRLKKKMVKIFEKLCELKRCSSLTGRVIEQRIAFTGTRYPEINRKVERFINKPDHFPDYQDIRNIMQQVSIKHSLGLSQRQIQSMAQDVFREVGNRLQERRHLDLVYNFGSHLTDDYKPGKDPAMSDITLEKRLRSNRSIALGRLDDVVKKYTEIQDVGELEEEEKRKKKKKLLQSAVSSTSEASKAKTEEVKEEQEKLPKVDESKGKDPEEEEMEEGARGSDEEGARGSDEEGARGSDEEGACGSDEEGARGSEEEEEDEEEDSSSDPDIEEELSKIEEVVEAEEGPAQEDEKADGSDVEEVDESGESDQSSDDSEENAESVEGQVEEGLGLGAARLAEGDVDSDSESSPVCTTHDGSECNDEIGGPAADNDGDDSPACIVEEGVGSSFASEALPAAEGEVGSSSEREAAEERVGSSSENRAASPAGEGAGSDDAHSPVCVAGKGDCSAIEDSPLCAAEEEVGSDEVSPPPTDHEGVKGDLGELAVRRPKRKRADSSGQTLEAPTAKPNPKTVSKALQDLAADGETITNNLAAHEKCNAATSPCYEPNSLSTVDDTNLDRKCVVKKENLDILETDEHSPDIYLTAINGEQKDSINLDSSPIAKRIKRGQDVEMRSGVEVIELMESDEGMEEPLIDRTEGGVGVKSPLPAVDSTRADSPLVSVVTSSQPSPVNVATQCDPEEIIVLSDSD